MLRTVSRNSKSVGTSIEVIRNFLLNNVFSSHITKLILQGVHVVQVPILVLDTCRTLNEIWARSSHFHLSGYDSIQKVHFGLAKNFHLSGFFTYAVFTYPVLDHVQNIGQKFGA